MLQPKIQVSILLPVFNGKLFLKEQVDSIVQGSIGFDKGYEILIGDDGSDDDTLELVGELVSQYDNVNISAFSPSFRCLNKNLNFLFLQAKGDLIFFCDQDDIWCDRKLEFQSNALDDADICAHTTEVFGADRTGYLYPRPGTVRNFFKNTIVGSTLAGRRAVFNSVFPLPLDVPHDQYIACILGFRGVKWRFIDQCLSRHRIHSSNNSMTGGVSNRSLATIFLERLRLLGHSIERRCNA